MFKNLTFGMLASFFALSSQPALSLLITSQDFNSLSDAGTASFDSVSNGSLLTNAGSFNSGGPGLDFSTRWNDTRGVTSGPVTATSDTSDFIGVNSFAGSNAPNVSPDGTAVASGSEHNYEFNDGDGALVLTFESVDLSTYVNRYLSLDYWITDTGYESDDNMTVSLSNGGLGIVLLSLSGTQLETNSSADDGSANWMSLLVDLDALFASSGLDPSNSILSIAVDNNASSENIFVDNIRFETRDASVPAPATLALFGLGLAGLGWARRKKV